MGVLFYETVLREYIGLTTIYTISAYHHLSCEFKSHSWRGVLDTTLCDKVCLWLAAGQWFSLGTPVSSTNKTDHHDITENVVESGVKHHNPLLTPFLKGLCCDSVTRHFQEFCTVSYCSTYENQVSGDLCLYTRPRKQKFNRMPSLMCSRCNECRTKLFISKFNYTCFKCKWSFF
jgi:hypothetical protein